MLLSFSIILFIRLQIHRKERLNDLAMSSKHSFSGDYVTLTIREIRFYKFGSVVTVSKIFSRSDHLFCSYYLHALYHIVF